MVFSNAFVRNLIIFSFMSAILPLAAKASDKMVSKPKENNCIMKIEYTRSEDFLHKAHLKIKDQRFEDAISILDEGIAFLGDGYYHDDLIDDTGMKITLSQIEQKKGHIEVAANLKYAALSSRLDAYLQHLGCQKEK